MKIINLIAGPRNRSTTLMYSFAQREDMQVLDEPFYGYYLAHKPPGSIHPSREEIVRSMEVREEKIIENIHALSRESPVFVKGMAHHYCMSEPDFILDWENVLLVRHPEKLITSFAKVIPNPSLQDIGLKKSAELFLFLKRHGKTPIVIDSDELLKNPAHYLQKLCTALKVPFSKKMLSWKKGGIPEDGIWAKHWYRNLHNSEGFAVQKNNTQPLPKHLQPLLKEALPYYETLKDHILVNN